MDTGAASAAGYEGSTREVAVFRRIKKLLRSTSPTPPPRPRPAVSKPWPEPKAAPEIPSPDEPRALLLYKYDSCPFCRRVFRAIDELGLEVGMADTRQDMNAAKELRELTGGTQVPCLVIDGAPLLESADIVEWLTAYQSSGSSS